MHSNDIADRDERVCVIVPMRKPWETPAIIETRSAEGTAGGASFNTDGVVSFYATTS